jgi:hypothetical protein
MWSLIINLVYAQSCQKYLANLGRHRQGWLWAKTRRAGLKPAPQIRWFFSSHCPSYVSQVIRPRRRTQLNKSATTSWRGRTRRPPMTAIVKVVSNAYGAPIDVETLRSLLLFCGAGLTVSLLAVASFGLDLSPGFF